MSERELKRLRAEPESVEAHLAIRVRRLEDEKMDLRKEIQAFRTFAKKQARYIKGLEQWGTIATWPCSECGDVHCFDDEINRCKECKVLLCADCAGTCSHWQSPYLKCKWYACEDTRVYGDFCVRHEPLPLRYRFYCQSGCHLENTAAKYWPEWSSRTHREFPPELRNFVVFLWWCFKKQLGDSKDVTTCLIQVVVREWKMIEIAIENESFILE